MNLESGFRELTSLDIQQGPGTHLDPQPEIEIRPMKIDRRKWRTLNVVRCCVVGRASGLNHHQPDPPMNRKLFNVDTLVSVSLSFFTS